jgi:hypothetical protein
MSGAEPYTDNPASSQQSAALVALLERVRAAARPDRDLDRDLAVSLYGWCLHPHGRQRDDSAQSDRGYTCLDCGADSWGNVGPTGQRRSDPLPFFTASVDAALALVERVLPGAWGNLERDHLGYTEVTLKIGGSWVVEEHKTPALALLSALLAALSLNDAGEPVYGSAPQNSNADSST